MADGYAAFIASKHGRVKSSGFDVPIEAIDSKLFDWQRTIVQWAVRRGTAALFEDCGLGKTLQQLEWARIVHGHTGENALLLCPLAVQWQTEREAKKFNIDCDVTICESQDDVRGGISITNYEKLHHFDASKFGIVVLDESGILKAYTGATKRKLCDQFANTPYKLACTATPAPNDRMELGNHSEFLGVMPSNDMLARWFINDGGKCGNYRLKRHGSEDFWRWMASWSACISSPEDLGFDGSEFKLPALVPFEHVIECKPEDGYLFAVPRKVSATNVHKEKRAYLAERAAKVAELVNSDDDAWAVWVDTNYEADAIKKLIPDAVEVRGSHSDKVKEAGLRGFSDGTHRVIITKSEIGGFGLNWQHAHKTTWFAGYSYEKFYQAIRRLWRFGQKSPVEVHVVRTVSEGSVIDTLQRKQQEHEEMQREMASLMRDGMREEMGLDGGKPRKYEATKRGRIPEWLTTKA